MEVEIDIDRIFALDEELMHAEVPPDARAFQVASRLMREAGFLAYRLDDPRFEAYRQAYIKLFPNADKTGGWVGYGIVASMDDVRMVTVPLAFGNVMINVFSLCGFKTHNDYGVWVRGKTEIANETALAAFDALDFAYGVMDYQKASDDKDGMSFFSTAQANLEEISKRLPESGSYQTLSQCIHLVAETSIKAVLKHCGVNDKEMRHRELGHNLVNLAARLAVECPKPQDDFIISELVQKFPDYVNERYSPTNRPRLSVVRNALGAQFVAASCTRRLIPHRNSVVMVEQSGVVRDKIWYET